MAILEAIPEKLIVAFVTILITYLQTTANFYILGPALGGWTSFRAQKILLPMNVFLVSLYVNYYLACTTDPGHTPEGWVMWLLFGGYRANWLTKRESRNHRFPS